MTLKKNSESSPLICKIEYAFTEDISSMVKVGTHQVDITLKEGKVFQPLYGTPSMFNLSELAESTRPGLIHKQKLSVYYPGINSAVQAELLQLENRPIVVKVTYQHGTIQIIGSMTEPAKAFYSFNSSDATGYSITMACDSTERARFEVVA
jgi:hypothetical protein